MTSNANRKAFAHGPDPRLFSQITRRFFLDRSANTLGGLFASIALAGPTAAAQIASDDPRLRTERFAIAADWGKLDCYLAHATAQDKPSPAVIVTYDRLGLTPHIEDGAWRLRGLLRLRPTTLLASEGHRSRPVLHLKLSE